MDGYTRPMMLALCTAAILGGSVLAQGPLPGEKPSGRGERLEHLLTVRCGNVPLTDERAHRLVRIIDPNGRGVKNEIVSLWDPSSKASVEFSTDRFGVGEVQASRGTVLEVNASLVRFTLTGKAIRFPIEAITSRVHSIDAGEKEVPPWGSERLRQVLVVRTGTDTELSGRKVVRVLDQAGRGVSGAKVLVGFASSKRQDSYRTNQDGVAVLTRGAGNGLFIDAPPVSLQLFSGSMRFPVELVVSTDRKQP